MVSFSPRNQGCSVLGFSKEALQSCRRIIKSALNKISVTELGDFLLRISSLQNTILPLVTHKQTRSRVAPLSIPSSSSSSIPFSHAKGSFSNLMRPRKGFLFCSPISESHLRYLLALLCQVVYSLKRPLRNVLLAE